MRGRQEEGPGVHRTLEWIGHNDAGEAIARVVRILGPVWSGWRTYRAVALDDEAKVIELRPDRAAGRRRTGWPASAARWWGAPRCRCRRCGRRRRRWAGTEARKRRLLAVGSIRLYGQCHGSRRRQHGSLRHEAIPQDIQGQADSAAPASVRASQPKRADWVNLKVAWPQPKQAISLRIDQDILAWFRDRGPGYQTRMNAVLRAFVDAQQGRR